MTDNEKLEMCITFIKKVATLCEIFPEDDTVMGTSLMAAELLIDIGEKLPNES